jgi:hypothetical protein
VENTKTVLQSQFHDLKTDVHIIPIEWHAKLHSMVDPRMSLASLRTVPKGTVLIGYMTLLKRIYGKYKHIRHTRHVDHSAFGFTFFFFFSAVGHERLLCGYPLL